MLRVSALRTQEAAWLFLNHHFLISVLSQPCFKAGSQSIWGPDSIFQQGKKKKESKQANPPPFFFFFLLIFPKTSEA